MPCLDFFMCQWHDSRRYHVGGLQVGFAADDLFPPSSKALLMLESRVSRTEQGSCWVGFGGTRDRGVCEGCWPGGTHWLARPRRAGLLGPTRPRTEALSTKAGVPAPVSTYCSRHTSQSRPPMGPSLSLPGGSPSPSRAQGRRWHSLHVLSLHLYAGGP